MNTLVIHYFEGQSHSFPGIEVTIKSLREVYQGEVVVLGKNVNPLLVEFLSKHKITFIDCETYPVAFKTSPFNNKILYTYLYLKKHKEVLNKKTILFCDIGDMYFADNPFAAISFDELYFSLESIPIKKCDVNKTWLEICYNTAITRTIEENIVINSGFILGTFPSLFNLFDLMVKDMSKIFAKINYPITDQAIVNKLVYFDQIECNLGKDQVYNLSQAEKPTLSNTVTHQYKVSKPLTEFLYSKYNCKT